MTNEEIEITERFANALPKGRCYDVSYAVAMRWEHMEMLPMLALTEDGMGFHFANYNTLTNEILDFTKNRSLGKPIIDTVRVEDFTPKQTVTVALMSQDDEMYQLLVDATWMNNGYVDVAKRKDTGAYAFFMTY